MRNNLKEFKKLAREVRLSADEKSAMRGELLRHMEMHPVVKKKATVSPFFSMKSFRKNRMLPVFVTLGLVMGGSVSFAAENTLPGDFLYPVKVHLNEPVRGAIYVSPEAKAGWDVRLVERRLKEIEKIESKEGVSLKVKEAAQVNFEVYTERVNKHISKFEERGDSVTAIAVTKKFTKVLLEHEEIINLRAQRGQNSDESKIEFPDAVSHALETRSKTENLREKMEEKQKDLEEKNRTRSKERP